MVTIPRHDVPHYLEVLDALGASLPQVIRTDSLRFASEACEAIASKLCELECDHGETAQAAGERLARLFPGHSRAPLWSSTTLQAPVAEFLLETAAAKRARLAGEIRKASLYEGRAEKAVKRLRDFGISW